MVRTVQFVLLGFGSVAQHLADLLAEKRDRIRTQHGIEFRCVGLATRSHGMARNANGIDLQAAKRLYPSGELVALSEGPPPETVADLIRTVSADLLVELTVLDPVRGEPALGYIRLALEQGQHVVTANKGPLALAYRELREQARTRGLQLRFESTVMDGMPIFSMARCGLPVTHIQRLRGILNSTTHLVLTEMEQGRTLEEAVRKAQELGIAEADPRHDLEGWDAAVKICVLANVLMDASLTPADVDRTGITGLQPAELVQARQRGQRIKLVCEAWREAAGVRARVAPQTLSDDDLLARLTGTATALEVQTDTLVPFAIMELGNSTPRQTAFGVLADMIDVCRHL